MPIRGWKLLVRGKLHRFHRLRFTPPQPAKYVTLQDPKQVRLGSVTHSSLAAQASKKVRTRLCHNCLAAGLSPCHSSTRVACQYIVVAGIESSRQGSIGGCSLEVSMVPWLGVGCVCMPLEDVLKPAACCAESTLRTLLRSDEHERVVVLQAAWMAYNLDRQLERALARAAKAKVEAEATAPTSSTPSSQRHRVHRWR